jgi:hypothetical protein
LLIFLPGGSMAKGFARKNFRIFATIGQRFHSEDAVQTWDWTG